jgi:hypothetical protein
MKRHLPLLVACSVASAAAQSSGVTRPSATIDSGALQGANFGATPNEVMFLGRRPFSEDGANPERTSSRGTSHDRRL